MICWFDKTQCGITPHAFEHPMTPILSIRPEDTGVSTKTHAPTGTMCAAVPPVGGWMGFPAHSHEDRATRRLYFSPGVTLVIISITAGLPTLLSPGQCCTSISQTHNL